MQWTNIVSKGLSPVIGETTVIDDLDEKIDATKEKIGQSTNSDTLHLQLAFYYLIKRNRLITAKRAEGDRNENPMQDDPSVWANKAIGELKQATQLNATNALPYYCLSYIYYQR